MQTDTIYRVDCGSRSDIGYGYSPCHTVYFKSESKAQRFATISRMITEYSDDITSDPVAIRVRS